MFNKKNKQNLAFEEGIFKGDNLAKAKALFFRYRGNTFGMTVDGFYDEYKACNISKETENLWLQEMNED